MQSIEGVRASYSWRQRSSSMIDLPDDHGKFVGGSDKLHLARSLGGDTNNAKDQERTRSHSDAVVAATEDTIATDKIVSKDAPTLLEMLKTVKGNDEPLDDDKDDDKNVRSSPTSVAVEMPTPPEASTLVNNAVETVKGSSNVETPALEMEKSDDDESTDDDDDDDGNAEIHLDTSSKRKSMQIAALELALEQAQAQRTKMISNIQKKKQALAVSDLKMKALAKENAELKANLLKLNLENSSLHSGMAKITSTRDELRNKLRIKQDVLRETRAEKDETEKKLKRSEQCRVLEQELLQNYRRLAIHTGYFKWGKEIRMLEAALEKANAEQQE
ncbi:hypothetical protein MPSEU_000592800 [Mayamaea pseudoterrestris]|nr:hypothetical protein MPSEU_000592800 [Mayamaea pseudoterrestris]